MSDETRILIEEALKSVSRSLGFDRDAASSAMGHAERVCDLLRPGSQAREEDSLLARLCRFSVAREQLLALVEAEEVPRAVLNVAWEQVSSRGRTLKEWVDTHDGPWEQFLRALHPFCTEM